MHEAAVANGSQQEWKGQAETEHRGAQAALRNRHGVTRPKRYIIKYSAIFAKGDFPFGSAIQIIENGFRNSPARDRPEIFDAYNPGGCYGSGSSRHLQRPEAWRRSISYHRTQERRM
jgi:hypothetical protein